MSAKILCQINGKIIVNPVIRSIVTLVLIMFSLVVTSQPSDFPQAHYLHSASVNETWQWSGQLHAENGKDYAFFFAINYYQKNKDASVSAQVYDSNQKKLMLSYRDNMKLDKKSFDNSFNWILGKAFVKYNDVNNTWVLGFSDKKQGFNFRVDSLKPFSKDTDNINRSDGTDFYTHRAKRLNGNLTLEGGDVFVTSNAVWMQHFWLNQFKTGERLQNIICHLGDKGDFYAFSLSQNKHPLFSLVNRVTAKGELLPVSQFIKLKQQDNAWLINLVSPQINWLFTTLASVALSDSSIKVDYFAGFIKQTPGFCLMAQIKE